MNSHNGQGNVLPDDYSTSGVDDEIEAAVDTWIVTDSRRDESAPQVGK